MTNTTDTKTDIQEQMEGKLAEWQKRLRLQDWDIKLEIVPAIQMDVGNAYGQVQWGLTEKCADIKIVNPDDVSHMKGMRKFDIEETLIHELIHLLMAPFDDSIPFSESSCQEFCINAIAAALYKLVVHERELVVNISSPKEWGFAINQTKLAEEKAAIDPLVETISKAINSAMIQEIQRYR